MRKLIIITLIMLIVSNSVNAAEKIRIAVMDLKPNNISSGIVSAVSDLARSALVASGLFTVVERSQMDAIFKEQALQKTGCTDTSCAVEIGKLLSANKVVVGEIIGTGKTVIITIRVVDVQSGVAEFSSTEKMNSLDTIDSDVNRLIIGLINNIGVEQESTKKNDIFKLSAPDNITATNGKYRDRIIITWSPVKEADKYLIFKLNVNNEYKLIETITGTSYNDKDVKEGNTYYYKIKSALSTRTSEFSSVVSGMSGKSEYGYYLRGFIPGWGQFYYNHDTKGCMFLGGFVLSSGFAGYAIYDYFNTKSAYNKVPLFSPRSEFKSKYNAYKNASTLALIATCVWGAIYMSNWVDVLFFNDPIYPLETQQAGNVYPGFTVSNDLIYSKHYETKIALALNYKF